MITLFLDVDGVLNSDYIFSNYHFGMTEDVIAVNQQPFSVTSLETLKEIVQKYNCKIVLSSCWRVWYLWDKQPNDHTTALNTVLNKYDMKIEDLTGGWERDGNRGLEIQDYIDKHNINRDEIIIIDDETHDMKQFTERIVKTNFRDRGLLPEHLKRVDQILNKGDK